MMLSPRDALLFSIASFTPQIVEIGLPFLETAADQFELRYYQEDIITELVAKLRQGYRRILIVLPTGAGKTVLAAALIAAIVDRDRRAQFVVHRKELIKQTSGTFTNFGIPHGFVASAWPMDPTADVVLAGVQTLTKRLTQVLPPHVAIVDEAHHAAAASWSNVMDEYADSVIIGLTATPERLDGKGLDAFFDTMVLGPSVSELIHEGFLSTYSYYAPSQPDLAGVNLDVKAQVAAAMDKPKLIGDTVEHYLRLANGLQGIVFAASREHSRHLADAFRANGVPAAHIDGTMDDERERADEAFRAGDLRILTNVDLLGEGYDVPSIGYVGLDRPTKSIVLARQQPGRALRIFPGKVEGIICDHASIWKTHGLPDDERLWKLEGRAARLKAEGANDGFSIHQCPLCFRVTPSTVKVCPGCGEAFQVQERKIKTEEGQLSKIEKDRLKKEAALRRKHEERQCQTHIDYENLAQQRGYQNPYGWARMKMKMKANYRPRL